MEENAQKPSIKKEDSASTYQVWPFRAVAVSLDGDRNNGGIDLIANPELIDTIHEASDENGLRPLFISMNSPERAFMTLGCAAGEEDGIYYSYVEFTPRDGRLARDETTIVGIHREWMKWTEENCSAHQGLSDALRQSVEWTYRPFSLRGSAPQFLITIYSRARAAQDHGSLISWVHNFLCSIQLEDLPG